MTASSTFEKSPSFGVEIDRELAAELAALGKGDIALGIRVAVRAAVDLATEQGPPPVGYDSLILRHVRAAESVAEHTKRLLLYLERYEEERRAFLDGVARIGRLEEDLPR